MAICIRRAKEEDAEAIGRILFEVHAVHHAIRPDLFLEGKRKYDEGEVKALIDRTPVLVAEEAGEVLGYAVCFLEETKGGSMAARKTLYLDDLCVDEAFRKRGVGRRLFAAARFSSKENCLTPLRALRKANPPSHPKRQARRPTFRRGPPAR